MKMKKITIPFLSVSLLVFAMTSCNKDKKAETRVVVTDSVTMDFLSNHFTFYSLSEGKVIPLSDSATSNWDFAINFASLIFNSHASGPGDAGVIMKMGNYETFTTAPTDGYSYDTTATQRAINSSPFSPDAWYVYIEATRGFAPKAGLFFVLKTATGKYAKLEITEVTYGDWDGNLSHPPGKLIYKFRYTYQEDGSVNLQ